MTIKEFSLEERTEHSSSGKKEWLTDGIASGWWVQAEFLKINYWLHIANNIVITVYGVRQVLDLSGDHFISYIKVYSLCCTSVTNINIVCQLIEK